MDLYQVHGIPTQTEFSRDYFGTVPGLSWEFCYVFPSFPKQEATHKQIFCNNPKKLFIGRLIFDHYW